MKSRSCVVRVVHMCAEQGARSMHLVVGWYESVKSAAGNVDRCCLP